MGRSKDWRERGPCGAQTEGLQSQVISTEMTAVGVAAAFTWQEFRGCPTLFFFFSSLCPPRPVSISINLACCGPKGSGGRGREIASTFPWSPHFLTILLLLFMARGEKCVSHGRCGPVAAFESKNAGGGRDGQLPRRQKTKRRPSAVRDTGPHKEQVERNTTDARAVRGGGGGRLRPPDPPAGREKALR